MLPIKIDFDLKSTPKDLADFAKSSVWEDIVRVLHNRVQDLYEQFVEMDSIDPKLTALHATHKECHNIVNMLLMLVEENKENPDARSTKTIHPTDTTTTAAD